MTANKGKHQHTFSGTQGQAKIYCNVDTFRGGGVDADPEWKKGRAIRKVIRTLIEANGGDGEAVKKDIETNNRGVVWYKDERVAEWKAEKGQEGNMKLVGAMLPHEAAYRDLMENKTPQ